MSRIGRKPIVLPEGVNVEIKSDEKTIVVKGPKGQLEYRYPDVVDVEIDNNVLKVKLLNEDYPNYWGLARSLINNMVIGVTQGFEKRLLVIGVGYSAKVQGSKLVLNLGYSHPIEYSIPEGIKISTEKDSKGNDIIIIQGIDKQKVGQVAAVIREFRPPEPYKGKGIRYIDEEIKLKAGKQAKK